jgi:hypothetical protein
VSSYWIFSTGILSVALSMSLGSCGRGGGPEPASESELTPEIKVGAEAFDSTQVSSLVGWVQSGVYDAKEGLEIAVLEYGKISFLDPKSFALKRIVEIDDDRIGYKQLVSLRGDSKLNLIAGGGGYSDVGFFDLKGHSLCQFKPDKRLHPNQMIACDLDGDGTKEFYAADHAGVFQLDSDGQIVWRSDNKLNINWIVLTLPAEGERPAAVVTDRGIWDSQGKPLKLGVRGTLPWVGKYNIHPVKWGDIYCIASGDTYHRGDVDLFDLAGTTVFKHSLGDQSISGEILAARLKRGEAPYLVVVAALRRLPNGRKRDLMALNILSHDGTLVYQEFRKPEVVLVIPDDHSGVDTLLLGTGRIKTLKMK